jgi:hypothetical protein
VVDLRSDSTLDQVLDRQGVPEVGQDSDGVLLQGESGMGRQNQDAINGLAGKGGLPQRVVIAQQVVVELASLFARISLYGFSHATSLTRKGPSLGSWSSRILNFFRPRTVKAMLVWRISSQTLFLPAVVLAFSISFCQASTSLTTGQQPKEDPGRRTRLSR